MKPAFPLEMLIWIGGLGFLAFSEPDLHHFTLCPLSNLGLNWCPGCGLGRAITSLLHFEILSSIKHHWFGIPAFFILLARIWLLFQKFILNYNLQTFIK